MGKILQVVKQAINALRENCPNCKIGHMHYSGEDWTGRVWLSVYECDNCHKEYL